MNNNLNKFCYLILVLFNITVQCQILQNVKPNNTGQTVVSNSMNQQPRVAGSQNDKMIIRPRPPPPNQCEDGFYWNYSTNQCEESAKLHENCTERQCSPSLYCQEIKPNSNVLQCTYRFKNYYITNCPDINDYPRIEKCQKKYFLKLRNGIHRCSDECYPYSNKGEYCDNKQPCYDPLRCLNNICRQAEICDRVDCIPVPTSCPSGTYLLQANGLPERCCPYCQAYAEEDERCGDELYCATDLYCDWRSRTCTKYTPPPCKPSDCEPLPPCEDGYILQPDGQYQCCPQCIQLQNFGDYCDDVYNLKCMSAFTCQNNSCVLKENCKPPRPYCEIPQASNNRNEL